MLERIDLKFLNELYRINGSNVNPAYEFVHASFFKNISRVNCKEVLETNNLIQVLTGIVYHNDFEQFPVTVDFKVGMNLTELINIPTIRMMPSIFENIRFFRNGEKFFGVWVSKLLQEAKLAYEKLYEEDKIDNSLKSIFRIKNQRNSSVYQNKATAFEIKAEEHFQNINDILNDKLIVYLLSECYRNNGYFGVPLLGWTLDEINNSIHFLTLKKSFNRVFVVGSGEEWQSTHLIVVLTT